MLKQKERDALARRLLAARPPVLPGTRAIIDEGLGKVWFACVSAVQPIVATGEFTPEIWKKFCDDCGVPD